jgi:FkbM family methyltransferase
VVDRAVHTFDNGVRVYRSTLIPQQLERYTAVNLHEPEEERIFLELLDSSSEGLFLDVGAGIGYYSILAKRVAPGVSVHAFEPLPIHRQAITEHLALNRLGVESVKVHPEAVAARAGRAAFARADYGSRVIASPGRLRRRGTVPTTTVDRFLAKREGVVALAKVDVQGTELAVLAGARSSLSAGRVRAWLIGTHSMLIHDECIAILTGHDYEIVHADPAPSGQPDGIVAARATRAGNR